jgi:DNA repair photolyase
MDHAFEDIEVKENALELLEDALRRKRKPCMIGTGSMSDPYAPLELKTEYTRKALLIIEKYGCGVALQTKSNRVLRDLDILKRINEKTKAVVQMTLTTADENLCKIIEPNVCSTKERFEALKTLRDNGVPTVVWLCPILPYINDTHENIESILRMCIEAQVRGVICFGMGLTLRDGSREYFYRQLDRHFPGLKERYIREYGDRYEIPSPRSNELMSLFHHTCEQNGIMHNNDEIFAYLQRFEEKEPFGQLSLWQLQRNE